MPGSSRCTEAERRASGSTRVRDLAATVGAPRRSSPVAPRRRTRFVACRAAHPAPVVGTRCGRGRCPAQVASPVTSVQCASVRARAEGPTRRSIFGTQAVGRKQKGRRGSRDCVRPAPVAIGLDHRHVRARDPRPGDRHVLHDRLAEHLESGAAGRHRNRPSMRSPLHPRILRGVGIQGRATMIDRLGA